jgi:hypothetical protein
MTAAHKTATPFYASPSPVLIAERARDASAAARCVLCRVAVRRGDRVADLAADGGGLVHVGCASKATGVAR